MVATHASIVPAPFSSADRRYRSFPRLAPQRARAGRGCYTFSKGMLHPGKPRHGAPGERFVRRAAESLSCFSLGCPASPAQPVPPAAPRPIAAFEGRLAPAASQQTPCEPAALPCKGHMLPASAATEIAFAANQLSADSFGFSPLAAASPPPLQRRSVQADRP